MHLVALCEMYANADFSIHDLLIFKHKPLVRKLYFMQWLTCKRPNLTKGESTALVLTIVSGFAGFLYFFSRRKAKPRRYVPGHFDIEIRYAATKDADATLLAQNQVKIIKMVLTPLEKRIQREKATLIYVYGGDFWEMRLRNASEQLKHAVKDLLEAEEW